MILNLSFNFQNNPKVSLSEKLDEAVKIRESMKSKGINVDTMFTCEICSKPFHNESKYHAREFAFS